MIWFIHIVSTNEWHAFKTRREAAAFMATLSGRGRVELLKNTDGDSMLVKFIG